MKKKIFVFLFNGFSDWEIAYLTPELKKSSDYELVCFSQDGNAVLSMGGLNISPQVSLKEIDTNEVEMLILPGGTVFENESNDFLDSLVNNIFETGKTIAAICAATTYLGRKGFLNNLKHTSNALFYLKNFAPEYSGEQYYVDSFAVSDQNIIIANGVAPIEFAREIFKKLKIHNDGAIEKWFQLFKNGMWKE